MFDLVQRNLIKIISLKLTPLWRWTPRHIRKGGASEKSDFDKIACSDNIKNNNNLFVYFYQNTDQLQQRWRLYDYVTVFCFVCLLFFFYFHLFFFLFSCFCFFIFVCFFPFFLFLLLFFFIYLFFALSLLLFFDLLLVCLFFIFFWSFCRFGNELPIMYGILKYVLPFHDPYGSGVHWPVTPVSSTNKTANHDIPEI